MLEKGLLGPVRRLGWRAPAVSTLLVACGATLFLVALGWMIYTWGEGGLATEQSATAAVNPTPVEVPAVALPSEQRPVRLFTGADPFREASFTRDALGGGSRSAGSRLTLEVVRGRGNRERAVLRSGNRRYVAFEGDEFGGSYVLIDAWKPCTTLFNHGRFTLCEGHSTTR